MELSLFAGLVWFMISFLVVRASGFALQQRATATPTPISVAPAQNWDGDDGQWSSFTIRVGTPAQNVRVFISTSSPETWVVLDAGCTTGDNTCLQNRGSTYNYNASSTWSQHGSYKLGTEQNLNNSVQAFFGNETLGLGIQGSGGPTLPDQIIGAFASEEYYLGMFGLNPASTNFTPQDQGRQSYMSTLKNQSLIPSLSFGYTAGAKYRLKQVLGSLTLGGVDSSRFIPNNLSIPFAPDPSRDLMVGIQSIKSIDQSGKTTDLLPTGIMSFLDSTIPQIWLPLGACQAFEKAFGLMFDETSELYLVNSSLHDQLISQNASFTFMLGVTATGGQTLDVTLPYDSFDLLVTPPTNGVANNSRYFPLRRAANDTQYTLGRTFLQEAYLTVDWERQNFSISQCTFEDNMSQNLVPIASIDDKSSSSTSSGSSTGKTAGIAVGVIIGVLVIASAIGAYFFYRYKQNKRDTNDKALSDGSNPKENFIRQGYDKGELPTGNDNQRYEMLGSDPSQPKPPEPLVSPWVNEKANHPGAGPDMAEVDSGHVSVPELTGSQQRGVGHRPLHEMQDPSVPPIELPGDHPQAGELHGSNPTSPRVFARRSRRSNAASPVSHSSSTKRRSWRERLSGRPEASRSSTLDSLPSLTSSTGASPPAAPKEEVPVGSGHSGEPFSPVSRQGTFSPDPVSRQGTFSLDPVSRQGNFKSDNASNQLFSPVSPSSPETNRGMFERFEEPSK